MHLRSNYYDVAIALEVADGAWKITGLELLEEKRVEPGVPIKGKEQDTV